MVLGTNAHVDLPPGGEYLMAFPSRFSIIWRIRMGLARKAGSPLAISWLTFRFFCCTSESNNPNEYAKILSICISRAGIESGFQPPEVEQFIDQGCDAVDAALYAADNSFLLLGQRSTRSTSSAYPSTAVRASASRAKRMHEVAFHLVEHA